MTDICLAYLASILNSTINCSPSQLGIYQLVSTLFMLNYKTSNEFDSNV